ncbi:MAG: hypothetical protein WBN65_10640 [Gammaproteobacteria bacterium]
MSIFVDKDDQFHHAHGQHFAVSCPSCSVLSHISPVSWPRFDELERFKPNEVGVVFRCDACGEPVFLKYPIKAYLEDRVELSTNYQEIERPRERFDFTYLPEDSEILFREALNCYSANCMNAFASMCRRTVRHVFADLGESGKMRIYEQCNDIRDMAEVDEETFDLVRQILFESDGQLDNMPMLSGSQAGVLMEFMRDILYQSYVRKGKLQQAMMMRRYLTEDAAVEALPEGNRSTA